LSTSPSTTTVAVLGAGNYGTCLAQHLANINHQVILWARSREAANNINNTHQNLKYFKNFILSGGIRATNKIDDVLKLQPYAIILAVPSQALRELLGTLKGRITTDTLLVIACKGIEVGTMKLPADIVGEVLGPDFQQKVVTLSGPSFAVEVMQKQPTAVSVGSKCTESAASAQRLVHSPYFRAYTSTDPVGLEVAGALKNVIAIAAGGARGLGFQSNTMAAIVTRGLSELIRAGVALGAQPLTFIGLGGVGDLFLTCTSEKSRNFTLGFRLGKGDQLAETLRTLGSVAEGYQTALATHFLSKKIGIDLPICAEVYQVLHKGKPVRDALEDLLAREARPEFDI
jgi:glycerol-3-phosphate dehydrogenase (NAD(P)+)